MTKQLHKSMALEKRGSEATLDRKKHKRTSKEDGRPKLSSHSLQKMQRRS